MLASVQQINNNNSDLKSAIPIDRTYFSKEKYKISVRCKPGDSKEGAARISRFVMTRCHNHLHTSSTSQVLSVRHKYCSIITQVLCTISTSQVLFHGENHLHVSR